MIYMIVAFTLPIKPALGLIVAMDAIGMLCLMCNLTACCIASSCCNKADMNCSSFSEMFSFYRYWLFFVNFLPFVFVFDSSLLQPRHVIGLWLLIFAVTVDVDRIPWFQWPIIYDIRAKPRRIASPTGSKGEIDNDSLCWQFLDHIVFFVGIIDIRLN